jgi:hypothetical protein
VDGAAAGLAAAGAAGNEADGPLEHFPDTLPPAPLVAVDQDAAEAYDDEEAMLGQGQGSSSDNALEATMAIEGTAQGGPGGKVRRLSVVLCLELWLGGLGLAVYLQPAERSKGFSLCR